MKLQSAFLTLALATLAACGGDATADVSVAELLQAQKYEEAVEAAETLLQSVEKGTEAERELILDYAQGLSFTDTAKAQKSFMEFAEANTGLVTPKDYKFVVSYLRTNDAFIEAIDVMHAGKTRWPDDSEMVALVEILKADVEKANDPAAKAKMKGLGYM